MQISYITHIREGQNIGSMNQALGVVEATKSLNEWVNVPTTTKAYDVSEIPQLAATLSANTSEPHVVIGVGDDGVKAFAQLPHLPNDKFVLVGHEVPKGIENIKDKIDVLAVPEHVTNIPDLGKVRIVQTHGVSHNLTHEKAQKAYEQWKDTFAAQGNVVVAMLGGKVDGKDYTPEEAYKFGLYAAGQAKERGAELLATNSPRASQENIAAFNKALEEQKPNGAFFRFDGHQDASAFHALIGIVKNNPNSLILTTGDSVSMPSEAASIVGASQLQLYPVSNQNAGNTAFVEWMRTTSRAGVVGSPTVTAVAENAPMDAGYQIAAAVTSKNKVISMPGIQPSTGAMRA